MAGWLSVVVGSLLVLTFVYGFWVNGLIRTSSRARGGLIVLLAMPATLLLTVGSSLLRAGPILTGKGKWLAVASVAVLGIVPGLFLCFPAAGFRAAGAVVGGAAQAPPRGAGAKADIIPEGGDYARTIAALDEAIKATPSADSRAALALKRTRASLAAQHYTEAWEDYCIANALSNPMRPGPEDRRRMLDALPLVSGVPADEKGRTAFWYAGHSWDAGLASDFAGERSDLEKAVSLAPSDRVKAAFLYQRAYLLMLGKDREKASQDYREACRLNGVLDAPESSLKDQIEGKAAAK